MNDHNHQNNLDNQHVYGQNLIVIYIVNNHVETYRCVPKIVSPKARTISNQE